MANYTDYRNKLKAMGLCVQCGKKKVAERNGRKLTLCPECAEKHRKRTSLLSAQRLAEGHCQYCNSPVEPGQRTCENCRAKRRAKDKQYNKTAAERKILKKFDGTEDYQTLRSAAKSKYYEGEEKYRSVKMSDEAGVSIWGLDTKENINRCLNCEIPVQYCTGGNCVIAYRTWKYIEELREKYNGNSPKK